MASKTDPFIQKRLEYLRGEIRAERISYEELSELQALAAQGHISPGDLELLEAAGVPEHHKKAFMVVEVEFDSAVTDAESVSNALDTLMDTAKSTPGILGDYGNPDIGGFFPVDPEDIEILHQVAKTLKDQRQKDALANILHRLGALPEPDTHLL